MGNAPVMTYDDDANVRSEISCPLDNSSSAPPPDIADRTTPKSPSSRLGCSRRRRRRRTKRDRQHDWSDDCSSIGAAVEFSIISTAISSPPPPPPMSKLSASSSSKTIVKKKKIRSRMTTKHADDTKSGGIDALLPSVLCAIVLTFVIMAHMGFRGRATTAGIDLGTTNSVICVQSQVPSSSSSLLLGGKAGGRVGEIVCIPDPATHTPVVPSVVSFLDEHQHRSYRLTKEEKERHAGWRLGNGRPHPVDAVVGRSAKTRIEGHPHQTVYHAKRIIGREYDHPSVTSLRGEVDFDIAKDARSGMAAFHVPYHLHSRSTTAPEAVTTMTTTSSTTSKTYASGAVVLSPSEVGSYVIHHLMMLVHTHLGHTNVKSAVIAIPAKFDQSQRDATIRAYEMAGIKVARILEEPTAAALAYGLHKREDVQYVMVYDFGGGTLDVSMLYVGEGGYIDVLGNDGDERLGGADFDSAVARWLLEERGGWGYVRGVAASVTKIADVMSRVDGSTLTMNVEDAIERSCPKLKDVPLCTISSIHTLAERMKIGLSDHPNESGAVVEGECHRLPSMDLMDIPNTAEALCKSIVIVKHTLTLEEYDLAVKTLYERSLLPIQRLLKDLGLRKDEIQEVVMVGGTTRMPQIRELVRMELEKERLNTHIDPDLTVAYGAASVID